MEARLGGSYAAVTVQADVLQYKQLERKLRAEEKEKKAAEKATRNDEKMASIDSGSTHSNNL